MTKKTCKQTIGYSWYLACTWLNSSILFAMLALKNLLRQRPVSRRSCASVSCPRICRTPARWFSATKVLRWFGPKIFSSNCSSRRRSASASARAPRARSTWANLGEEHHPHQAPTAPWKAPSPAPTQRRQSLRMLLAPSRSRGRPATAQPGAEHSSEPKLKHRATPPATGKGHRLLGIYKVKYLRK